MKRCIGITKISHHTYKAKFLFHALLIFSLFLIVLPNTVAATAHYVRADATGSNNGSDWTNAWTDLPTTFTRGDTYYIADGTYGVHNFAQAESGSTYIYIYKATASSHGTATGWSSAYGDGQAIFTGDPADANGATLKFSTSYWELDGKAGSGSDYSTYGFKIIPDTLNRIWYGIGAPTSNDSTNGLDYITVKHTAIVCQGSTYDTRQYCIITASSTAGTRHEGMNISNNYFANGQGGVYLIRWTGGIIDSNYFAQNWGSSAQHEQQINMASNCIDVTISKNYFKNSSGYAIGFKKNQLTTPPSNNGIMVYNNIVDGEVSNAFIAFSTADSGTTDVVNRCYFHHNTFVNLTNLSSLVYVGNITDVASNKSFAYNNLAYNCPNPKLNNGTSTAGAIAHNNNAFFDCTGTYDGDEGGTAVVRTGDPFVDSAHGDFHLIPSVNIDAGAGDIETYPPPPAPPSETSPSQPTGLSIISG